MYLTCFLASLVKSGKVAETCLVRYDLNAPQWHPKAHRVLDRAEGFHVFPPPSHGHHKEFVNLSLALGETPLPPQHGV